MVPTFTSPHGRPTPEITAAMHELAVEQRRDLGVRALWHVGEIAWGLLQHVGSEDTWKFRVWKDGDRTVAWSWVRGERGYLDYDVRRDRLDLLEEIFTDPGARTAVAFEDDAEVQAALVRNGFARVNRQGTGLRLLARDLTEPPELEVLPEGFRYRTVEPDGSAERAAIHQAGWGQSIVNMSSFEKVQASWPYRASLDCVVEGPDGRFITYCLVWPDDENHVGKLAAGFREEFRHSRARTAVRTFALTRWYEEGGRQAIAECVKDAACGLYESIGFRRHATLVGYSRG
jgi:hypothetical protein